MSYQDESVLRALIDAAREQAAPTGAQWAELRERLGATLQPVGELPGDTVSSQPEGASGVADGANAHSGEILEAGQTTASKLGSLLSSKVGLASAVVVVGAIVGSVMSSQPANVPSDAAARESSARVSTSTVQPAALVSVESEVAAVADEAAAPAATSARLQPRGTPSPTAVVGSPLLRGQSASSLREEESSGKVPAARSRPSAGALGGSPQRSSGAPSSLPSAGDAEPTLSEEIRQLRPVEAALRTGKPERALTLLKGLSVRRLENQLAALRAIATCQAGQQQAGRRLARDFFQRWPRSGFSVRVSTACQLAPDGDQ